MRDDTSNDITGRILAVILKDLFHNPGNKYSWADQVGILLFGTIIGEDGTSTAVVVVH